MNNIIELDQKYSTTRRVIKVDAQQIASLVKAANKPADKFEAQLFLPAGENRQGEGGLRTKGYFKVGGIISSHSTPAASHVEKSSPETKPLITVVTVVFNGEKFLEETIISVINQTYDNVEYIIIDGGSNDGTLDIIKKHEHAIDYWVSEPDFGIYDAMNKGLRLLTGRYLLHLNAGDNLVDVLNDLFAGVVDVDLLFGDVQYSTGKRFVSSSKKMLLKNNIHHQGAFYSSKIVKKIGLYDTRFDILSDYHFNIRALKSTKNIQKVDSVIAICDDQGFSSYGRFKIYQEEMEIRREMFSSTILVKLLTIYSVMRFLAKKIIRRS